MKHCGILLAVLLLFSCTTKEDVRKYVEQDVLYQAEDYLIRQAIVKYVKEEAIDVFTDKINYYAENPCHDYSYIEKEFLNPIMAYTSACGGIDKIFDERRREFNNLYNSFTDEYEIRHIIEQDSTLTLRDLINESSFYSIEDIADIYFKPNHLKFTEITPELLKKIYRSMLCLGAKTYKYDVLDEIRVKEKENNKWAVDLVYHSGYCMPLEIDLDNDNRLFVSDAPWLPKSDCINLDNYAEKLSFEEALKLLYWINGIKEDPKKYKNYDESIGGKYEVDESESEFRSIDNYRLFLSDDAECNHDEEPLKTFICKILSNESFFKSRIKLKKEELEDFDINNIPTFRFYMDIDISFRSYKIVGHEKSVASWEDVTADHASYILYAGMDIWERFVFTRIDGKWYLTEYWDRAKDDESVDL